MRNMGAKELLLFTGEKIESSDLRKLIIEYLRKGEVTFQELAQELQPIGIEKDTLSLILANMETENIIKSETFNIPIMGGYVATSKFKLTETSTAPSTALEE
jgi:DNA-binding HxlR family transcriptional regulator